MIKSYDFEGKNPWEPKIEFNQGIGLIDPSDGKVAVLKPTENGGIVTICSNGNSTTLAVEFRTNIFFLGPNILIGFGTKEELDQNPTPKEISSCQRVNIQDLIFQNILPSRQTPEI